MGSTVERVVGYVIVADDLVAAYVDSVGSGNVERELDALVLSGGTCC